VHPVSTQCFLARSFSWFREHFLQMRWSGKLAEVTGCTTKFPIRQFFVSIRRSVGVEYQIAHYCTRCWHNELPSYLYHG